MDEPRGGLIGCGFFSSNHLHGWNELEDVRIEAVCDLDESRAEATGREFGIEHVYTDAGTMMEQRNLDFVDVVTTVESHRELVEAAADRGLHVICQKPLAASFPEAREIVRTCERAGVQFMVHENFRWQTPIRALKRASRNLGELFFGRISFRSGYDVYEDQPYLAERERFIVADLGIHLLDVARFLLGDVRRLFARTQQVNPDIEGEDVATVVLEMTSGATCVVEASYASSPETEPFPRSDVLLEGEEGSAHLSTGDELTLIRGEDVRRDRVPPHEYEWSSSPAGIIQDSVVNIQRHWVECLRDDAPPETHGRDNLKTLDLVFGSYESAGADSAYATRDIE